MIPIFIESSPPSLCPNCAKPEYILVKEICKHCGYEYPQEESTWTMKQWAKFVIIGIIILWIFITGISVITDSCDYHYMNEGDRCSVEDVLHTQQDMLRSFWNYIFSIKWKG